MDSEGQATVVAVAIGRNEGERLKSCLRSLKDVGLPTVYVDSGSTDGSLAAAEALGADSLALDMSIPFTAARARNAGAERAAKCMNCDFIQFIDGDCQIRSGWIEAAVALLDADPDVVAVGGRLRERYPEISVFNRLCDREWDTLTGEVESLGGIFLVRCHAFEAVGGFRDDMIAGEEPELCLRLRRGGGKIWRLPVEMAWHDAAITRFSQWWRRTRRGGYAFALGLALHGGSPEAYNWREVARALIWGMGLPIVLILGALTMSAWVLLGVLLYPLQVFRLWRRDGDGAHALFNTLGKIAEALGFLDFALDRLRGEYRGLIEYK